MTKIFSLKGKGLKFDTAADIETYLRDLAAISDVEAIDISGNTWGIDAVKPFAEVLKRCRSIKVCPTHQFQPIETNDPQTVNLSDMFTTRKEWELPLSLQAILDALEDKPVVELDLSSNALGPRCAPSLVSFITNNRSLQKFRMVDNGLGNEGGKIVAQALYDAAVNSKSDGRGKTQIKTLIISNNRLGWNMETLADAEIWCKALEAHAGTLEDVRLYQNTIRTPVMVGLIRALSKCKGLTHLDVSDNWLRIPGSKALATALPNWPELRVLNISEDQILPRGGVIIAEALSKGPCPKLEELNIKEAEVGEKTFIVLAQAIKGHFPKLIKLEVNGNYGSEEDEWIEKLREALEIHGNASALGDVDELEEYVEEEEEEEEEEEAEEKVEPPPKAAKGDVDDLADLMGKTKIAA